MRVVRVRVPPGAQLGGAGDVVESACARMGLTRSVKTTLKSYPGSVHWHFKKAGAKGTLEVTCWTPGGELWMSVHSNRQGDWTGAALRALRRSVERALAVPPRSPGTAPRREPFSSR